MSDIDSDCDDVFTDDSKGTTGTDDDCCHMNRKRRRGIIEKRRRDRINNSLSELRRLVPAAFEKQGSAKLEKAEILQMTVDHLRILHSKGIDVFTFDPQKFVTDYHGIGFRECASEVARYLVGFEGLDLQDPLRMRLMSHLQCFSAQRDLAMKSSSQSPWSPGFGSLPAVPTPHYPTVHPSRNSFEMSTNGYSIKEQRPSHCSSTSSAMSTETSSVDSPKSLHASKTPPPLSGVRFLASNFLPSRIAPFSSARSDGPAQTSPVRPYRPWGAEVAY